MPLRKWTRDELLVTFFLYCQTPFGKLHNNNQDIIKLASVIERSPSAVAMKLVNFASLDPTHQKRNVKGLQNVSKNDRLIFDEFASDWSSLVLESESARHRLNLSIIPRTPLETDIDIPEGPTESIRLSKVRTIQGFFRETVLASYEYQCAICGINIPKLLNASHIIPWKNDVKRRADPTNGLSLCALHDRAFDRGFLAINNDLRIILAEALKAKKTSDIHRIALIDIEDKSILLPSRFSPDQEALEYHRKNIFIDAA